MGAEDVDERAGVLEKRARTRPKPDISHYCATPRLLEEPHLHCKYKKEDLPVYLRGSTISSMSQERRRRCEAVATELREVASDLIRRLRAQSADQPLSMSQTSVLGRLYKEGPATVADLARLEHVKPQSMGTTVASLEEEGLVARKADANDGRRWLASLTEAGRRVLHSGRAARQAWLSHAIEERLDDGEQRRLADAIVLLRKVLDE